MVFEQVIVVQEGVAVVLKPGEHMSCEMRKGHRTHMLSDVQECDGVGSKPGQGHEMAFEGYRRAVKIAHSPRPGGERMGSVSWLQHCSLQ